MRHLLASLVLPAIAFGQSQVRPHPIEDTPKQIDLGEGLVAKVGYQGGIRFLYLPGRERPVEMPYGLYLSQAVLSPDRLLIVYRISYQRPDSSSDYFGLLVCRRSDVTEEASWTVGYALLGAELLLRFDLRTWVESIHGVTNEGVAILKLSQYNMQSPPAAVIRAWEEWDLQTQKRGKRIRDASPGDKF